MSKQIAIKGEDRLKSLLATDGIKKRFEEMLGSRAPSFISSVLTAVNSNKLLRDCEPMSVISSAAVAASMDLPVNPSLGFAHIVPYGDRAQFQIGWKGIIQLAMRSGQYKTINLTPVLEGQIKSHNVFTGEMEFQPNEKSNKQVGYLLYFKLLNGYEKYFYMTTEQCQAHGKRYSKSFAKGYGNWVENFEAMALKTVAKLGLSKYGILSLEMQKAITVDAAVISDDGEPRYVDNPENDIEPTTIEPQIVEEIVRESKPRRLKKMIQSDEPVASEPETVASEEPEIPL